MSLFSSEKTGSGKKYEPLEAASYGAVCVGLIDVGVQNDNFGGQKPKVIIVFDIIDEPIVTDKGEEYARYISKEYTNGLSEKGNLRKDLVAWRGKQFTAEELKKFDLTTIVGVPCMLSVGINKKGYNEILSLARVPKSMQNLESSVAPMIFNFDNCTCTKDVDYEVQKLDTHIPQWITDKIKLSQTYKDMQDAETNAERAAKHPEKNEEYPEVDNKEDLPF